MLSASTRPNHNGIEVRNEYKRITTNSRATQDIPMIGYTRAHRDRFNHPLFATQKFCRGYAWDWMVAQAAFKPHDIEIKGQTITLNRGQFSHSMRYMTKAFGWSLGVTQRFIDRLKTEQMIDTATNHGQIIITICKYDIYQADTDKLEAQNDTVNDTAAIQQRYSSDTNKNKGYNKGKNVTVSNLVRFEEFWNHFPHRNGAKKGKDTAKVKYLAAVKSGVSEEVLVSKAILYASDKQVLDGYGKGPTPWLNQKCWNDDIEIGVQNNGQRTNTSQGAERIDPALEQIARLSGL